MTNLINLIEFNRKCSVTQCLSQPTRDLLTSGVIAITCIYKSTRTAILSLERGISLNIALVGTCSRGLRHTCSHPYRVIKANTIVTSPGKLTRDKVKVRLDYVQLKTFSSLKREERVGSSVQNSGPSSIAIHSTPLEVEAINCTSFHFQRLNNNIEI